MLLNGRGGSGLTRHELPPFFIILLLGSLNCSTWVFLFIYVKYYFMQIYGYINYFHLNSFAQILISNINLQLPVGASDSELEERIIQHLAAAAAMGREHHRREGQRGRSESPGRPQFLVFSNRTNAPSPSVSSGSASSAQSRENEAAPFIVSSNISETQASVGEPPHQLSNPMPTLVDQITVSPPGISVAPSTGIALSNSRYSCELCISL